MLSVLAPFEEAPGVLLGLQGLLGHHFAPQMPGCREDGPKFLYGARCADAPVRHGVAVGAQRDKVRYGIQFVAGLELGCRHRMVHVDEAVSDLAVGRFKGEAACCAGRSMERQADAAGIGVALVAVAPTEAAASGG